MAFVTEKSRIKLGMICTCGDEGQALQKEMRDAVRKDLVDAQGLITDADDLCDVLVVMFAHMATPPIQITQIYSDMWLLVQAEDEYTVYSIQADSFTDALCGIYAHTFMGWDGADGPWSA